MSGVPSNQKNDIETIKNELRQELDERIIELVPALIDDATISRSARAVPDTDPEDEVVNGVGILFLKDKKYVESEPNEAGGYPEFGDVSKVDGQGSYEVKIGCKIVDDEEDSEYWEIEYSIVELTD